MCSKCACDDKKNVIDIESMTVRIANRKKMEEKEDEIRIQWPEWMTIVKRTLLSLLTVTTDGSRNYRMLVAMQELSNKRYV